jgi:hypothetical protein
VRRQLCRRAGRGWVGPILVGLGHRRWTVSDRGA